MSESYDDPTDAEDLGEENSPGECFDLDYRNRAEIKQEKIHALKTTLEGLMPEWKLEFKVVADGIDIMDGARRIAKVFDPTDAQRMMEIFKTHSYITKVAVESMEVISKLQKYAWGDSAVRTIKFVTDSNYILGILKNQPDVDAYVQKSLDDLKPNA